MAREHWPVKGILARGSAGIRSATAVREGKGTRFPDWNGAVPEAETRCFSISSRKARVCAESYFPYVAQANPPPDDEIAKKTRFPDGN